jgi:GTPase SAR1 family protein
MYWLAPAEPERLVTCAGWPWPLLLLLLLLLQESTIQATYLDKRLNVGKRSVKLMIWDTAGQERFHALGM